MYQLTDLINIIYLWSSMNDRDDVSLSDSIHQILNKMGPLVSLYENNDK